MLKVKIKVISQKVKQKRKNFIRGKERQKQKTKLTLEEGHG